MDGPSEVDLGIDLGSILELKSDPNRRKKGLILGSIFGASLGANGTLFPGWGGAWGTPHMRAFSTRKNEKARIQQEKET